MIKAIKTAKILFILILMLALALGAVSLFSDNSDLFSLGLLDKPVQITYHVWVSCPECTQDLLYVNDCIEFLEKIKDHPDFLNAAASINFDISQIFKIEKQVNINKETSQKEARCYYYSKSQM